MRLDEIVISKEVQFDAGHRVPNHNGKCRSPHGHRYRVEVFCSGRIIERPGDPAEGMLVDFGDLKFIMMEKIHDPLDHGFIVYENDHRLRAMLSYSDDVHPNEAFKVIVFPLIPTAENIARWCFNEMKRALEERFGEDLVLASVKVWETPTSMAMYEGA